MSEIFLSLLLLLYLLWPLPVTWVTLLIALQGLYMLL